MPQPEEPYKPSRRKSKKEMTDDEYIRVCERMAELREARKANRDKPKPEKLQPKEKVIIKYVDRLVEVPATTTSKTKTKQVNTQLDDHDDLRKELTEILSILNDIKCTKKKF